MQFVCTQDAFDNGDKELLDRKGNIITRGFIRDRNYKLTGKEIDRLLSIGLFPECFGPAVDVFHANQPHEINAESEEYWNDHIAEWEEGARKERVLPYRELNDSEEKKIVKLMAQGKTRQAALNLLVEEQNREPVTA